MARNSNTSWKLLVSYLGCALDKSENDAKVVKNKSFGSLHFIKGKGRFFMHHFAHEYSKRNSTKKKVRKLSSSSFYEHLRVLLWRETLPVFGFSFHDARGWQASDVQAAYPFFPCVTRHEF